jgi:hypothetical protein
MKWNMSVGPPLWSSGQSSRGPGFDSRGYQIFWGVMGLERGPLSLVSITEELLERKRSGCGLEIRQYGRREPSRWPRGTLYPQKLTLISPPSGGCSVGIVRSRTQATEFIFFFFQNILEALFILLLSKNVRHDIPDWLTNHLLNIQLQIKVNLARNSPSQVAHSDICKVLTHARTHTHGILINNVTLLICALCTSARQSTSPAVCRGGRVAHHEWQCMSKALRQTDQACEREG